MPARISPLVLKKAELPPQALDFSSSPATDLQESNAHPLVQESLPQPQRPSKVIPLSPQRYKIEITVGQKTRDNLAQLQALPGHQDAGRDPATVIARAIEELLAATLKKKAAAGTRPRRSPAKEPQNVVAGPPAGPKKEDVSRTIPAALRREVFLRDQGRCTFTDAVGHRCSETRRLEFHHNEPFALGGAHSVQNLRLLCRAHNNHEAEQIYKLAFMASKRSDLSVREPRVRYVRTPPRPAGQGMLATVRDTTWDPNFNRAIAQPNSPCGM